MQKPSSVKIGPFNYAIKYPETVTVGTQDCFGCCRKDQLQIEIRDKMKPSLTAVTLLHEILHGLTDVYIPSLPVKLEEQVVDGVAMGLVQVFSANPDLAKWLIATVSKD